MLANKTALITDLDNTLFDWVGIWHASFSAMLKELIAMTELDETQLKSCIRKVYQKYGTSEYAFVIHEVPLLRKFAGDRPVTEVFEPAIDAYSTARKAHTVLYPSVLETLDHIKKRGARVIGFTESSEFYTGSRIRKLKLDGVIDTLFCPKDHNLPDNLTRENIRKFSSEYYAFQHTVQKNTPQGWTKPDAELLDWIISCEKLQKKDCVYLGDSQFKDIPMAKESGVDHAWAKYGAAQERPEYSLLKELSHWPDDTIAHEKAICASQMNPDIVLEKSFSEILDYYEFGA